MPSRPSSELHLVFTEGGLALHADHALPLTFAGVTRVILHTRSVQLLQAIQEETAARPVEEQAGQAEAWPDEEGADAAELEHGPVLILHTMMRGYPALQRTLRVPGRATLLELHHALQRSYGWQDQHLNVFSIAGQDYEARTSDPNLGEGHLDAALYTVEATLPLGRRATYLYDWGARWRVDLLVCEVHLAASTGEGFSCLVGSRASIPESVFGEDTYLSYCSALRDHPRSALARRARAALGAHHDPAHFDLEGLNTALGLIPIRGSTR